MQLRVKKLKNSAKLPTRGSDQAAGLDLYACLETSMTIGHNPCIVPTGIATEIPRGYVGIIKDRSGLAAKKGLHTLAGVIDSDYRGEIGVVMVWHGLGTSGVTVDPGDKVAQMLIVPYEQVDVEESTELEETERNANGFGSTGK